MKGQLFRLDKNKEEPLLSLGGVKFCNILVMWGTIWQFLKLLINLLRWLTTLDCEMLNSPDILWVLFASIDWSTVLESMVFRFTWPCLILDILATQAKFLEPSCYSIVINCIYLFIQQMFLVASVELWPSLNL